MSFYTPPNTEPAAGRPQQQPFVGEFQFDRPTYTLSALVYLLYILALFFLAKWVLLVVDTSTSALFSAFIGRSGGSFGYNTGMALFGLGVTLIPVLVGRGIGHGSHDMWLLLLVLALLALVLSIPSLVHLDMIWAYTEGFSKVEALFVLTMPVVVLALSFTRAVRHHCAR